MSMLATRVLVGVAAIGALFASQHAAAQQRPPLQQAPDFQLLNGPGSDIRASVRELRSTDRQPSCQSGVVVEQIVRGGPADRAGVRSGDVVCEFDSLVVTDPKQFGRIVRDTPPGRKVRAIVWRQGNRREVVITPTAATVP